MTELSLKLPDYLGDFVHTQAQAHGFESANQYLEEVLKAQWREQKRAELAKVIEDRVSAFEQGVFTVHTPEFFDQLRQKIKAQEGTQWESP